MIRIGTRGSELAIFQARSVKRALEEKNLGQSYEIVIIKTMGDIDQKSSLSKIGAQGAFTKALEEALQNNEIDIAVHSLKDLPTVMADGHFLAGVLPRENPSDALLLRKDGGTQVKKIATSSTRRAHQIKNVYPDCEVVNIRGNIHTRIRKLDEGLADGLLIALAALNRLDLIDKYSHRLQILDPKSFIPSPSQGIIGIESREDCLELVKSISDLNTYKAAIYERAFLRTFGTGCDLPIGANYSEDILRVYVNGIFDMREIKSEKEVIAFAEEVRRKSG